MQRRKYTKPGNNTHLAASGPYDSRGIANQPSDPCFYQYASLKLLHLRMQHDSRCRVVGEAPDTIPVIGGASEALTYLGSGGLSVGNKPSGEPPSIDKSVAQDPG